MRNSLLATAGTLALTLAQAADAWAWGATGHFTISRMAALELPAELPAFLRTAEMPYILGELGRELDMSKGQGQTHDFERDPGHYVDFLDDGHTLGGGPLLSELPISRRDFDTALRAVNQTQYSAGYLPYSIVDGWQQIRADFAYIRALNAGEKFARDPAVAARIVRDRQVREMLTIRDIGIWSHYIADATMPLHVSVHFDGWGEYPNPKNYFNGRGLHAKFEGAFVRNNIVPSDVGPLVPALRDLGSDIWAETRRYIQDDLEQVIPLFELEAREAFDGPSQAGKDFVARRMALAVAEIRDLVVMAWRDSANASIGYPAVTIKDIEAGTVDPTNALFGLD